MSTIVVKTFFLTYVPMFQMQIHLLISVVTLTDPVKAAFAETGLQTTITALYFACFLLLAVAGATLLAAWYRVKRAKREEQYYGKLLTNELCVTATNSRESSEMFDETALDQSFSTESAEAGPNLAKSRIPTGIMKVKSGIKSTESLESFTSKESSDIEVFSKSLEEQEQEQEQEQKAFVLQYN